MPSGTKLKKIAGPAAHNPYLGLRAIFPGREARRAAALARRRAALTVDGLLHGVDRARLASLRQRCAEAGDGRPDVFWTKYLDAEKWLASNIRYVGELGLIENPPRDVLDLGCGGGFFLATCRALGARVFGLDLDTDVVLNEMIALFGIRRIADDRRRTVRLGNLLGRQEALTVIGIVGQDIGAQRGLAFALGQQLAHLERDQRRQLVGALAHQVGHARQQRSPVCERFGAPLQIGRLHPVEGLRDLLLAMLGEGGDVLAGRGIDGLIGHRNASLMMGRSIGRHRAAVFRDPHALRIPRMS